MQEFPPRSPDALITLGMDMRPIMPAGVTISRCEVSAEVWSQSLVQDDGDLAAMFQGAAGLASDNVTIRRQITGGVIDCVYVLSFWAYYSDGTSDVEQALQRASQYVPEGGCE